MAVMSCSTNPFLVQWDTPYGIPPFEKVKECHYIPAVKAGIEQQQAEIDAIIACEEAPSFENVIVAMDRSGETLAKVSGVLFNVCETDATPSLMKIVEVVTPMLSEHSDNIYMNPALFAKVEAVYNQKDNLGLTLEQEMVLKKIYEAFVRGGIALDEAGQQRMREINSALASLTLQFGNNLLAQSNAFKEEVGIAVSEFYPTMGRCEDREQREKIFKAYSSRGNNGGENDNKDIVLKIMALRIEQANLLGYETPAAFTLSNKMAHDPATVDAFLENIFKAAVERAKEEVADMQKVMDEDIKAGRLEDDATIQPWDYLYYAERVRKARYDLDENEYKPYFKMENVRAGVFGNASKLYGVSFEPVQDVALYNKEAEAFKVVDADGSLIGIIITDYYPRSTKRGGAWMNNFIEQYKTAEGVDVRPVIVNVGNFTKPTEDTPSLLTLDEVETMFHEFGHALHGLLSQCTYKTVSGTSVTRDFVELPSQINENWAFQKEVLATYAFHYETGEVIPDALVDKILAAENFNMGFTTTELAAASILDMKWHELTSVEGVDVEKFEKSVCEQMGLIEQIIPRYRSTYFNHIFGGSGYNAGYYSYLWAEVLDKDAFELFMQKGIFDKETAMSFRHNILEKGGSADPMDLYRAFRGADPDPAALLRARGLM